MTHMAKVNRTAQRNEELAPREQGATKGNSFGQKN